MTPGKRCFPVASRMMAEGKEISVVIFLIRPIAPSWFQSDILRQNFECGLTHHDGSMGYFEYCNRDILTDPTAAGDAYRESKTGIDEDIVHDSLRFTEFNEEMLWELKKSLYEKLNYDPSLMDNDSAFIAFYDSISNTPIADFSLVDQYGKLIVSIDSIGWAVIDQKKIQIEQDMDLIRQYEAQLKDGSLNEIDKQTFLDDIDAMKISVKNLESEIHTIVLQLNSGKLVIVNTAQAVNNGIGAYATVEQNLQEVNEIYLATIAKGNRDLNPYASTLLSIAQQCPVAGGIAVMKARALYALIDRHVLYDDEDICLQQGVLYRHAVSSTDVKEKSYRFYPNPANSTVTFIYHLDEGSKATLKLSNNMGQTVMDMVLYSGRCEVSFDVSDLANGIYTASVGDENGVKYKSKLAIIK